MTKLSTKLRTDIKRFQRLLKELEALARRVELAETKAMLKRSRLPVARIGKEEWLAVLTTEPQTLGSIVDQVMERMSIEPMYRRAIVQRCVVYLNTRFDAGEIIKQGPPGRQTYRRRGR